METWAKVVMESFRKVWDSTIYKIDKLIISKKYLDLKTRDSEKSTYKIYFLQLPSYIFYVSGVTLSNNNYGRKKI